MHIQSDFISFQCPDDWQIENVARYIWRLSYTDDDTRILVSIANHADISLQQFSISPEKIAIQLGMDSKLKKFDQLYQWGIAENIYWFELRKSAELFRTENGTISYKAFLVQNDNDYRNVYACVSVRVKEPEFLSFDSAYGNLLLYVLRTIEFHSTGHSYHISKNSNDLRIENWLNNTRLVYQDNYNSGQYSGGGGYLIEKEFRLYSNGAFQYKYFSSVSVNSYSGVSLGGGYKEDKGSGNWQVSNGQLVLAFADGRNWGLMITEGSPIKLDGEIFAVYNL
ncbi:MAG: hypothetical protein JNL57_09770 [Bacteroidetes bacterium]|nr:hypothetical protein [Bacteroidota bacterium]